MLTKVIYLRLLKTLSDNYIIMSSDEQKIPVAAVSADSAEKEAPPVKLVKVSETAWNCVYGGKTYNFSIEDESYPIYF